MYSNYGNNFILCRVISDIRPVFDIEIDESPKAGIILHSLNIHYQSNEEPLHKNITLTLNSDSIKLLKEALTRAENKENSLKRILEMSEMRNLNE